MTAKTPLEPIASRYTGKDIVSLTQFDRPSVELLFDTITQLKKRVETERMLSLLKKHIVGLFFFEPSSRTFSSFSVAVKRLGGNTLEMQEAGKASSSVKGETLEDMGRVMENYLDAIIMRHPEVGSVEKVARAVSIPVLNAGDGSGEHPTQGLMDMFTMLEHRKSLDGIRVLISGDLLYGRTVHSLLFGLSLFSGVRVTLLSPERLRLPAMLIDTYRSRGITITEIHSESDIPADCDVWYWTRVQKERFDDLAEYERIKNAFILTPELVKQKGSDTLILMHPLPRVGEIEPAVDDDPRAVYFTRQVKNGMYTRMALLTMVLGAL
ncbi:MAG: aspartate carbamoyltransferase [Patescibacteria group bacterium]|nr:aspartate carbamoyltransferase [Patescibacteria group bacterium]